MARQSSTWVAGALTVAVGLYACGDPDPGSEARSNPPAPPDPAPPPAVAGVTCGDLSAVRPSDLRRLNGNELANTLRAALGPVVYAPVGETLALLGSDAIRKDPSDLAPAFGSSQLEAIDRVSKRVGAVITSSDDNLKSAVGACGTATPIAETCVSSFIGRFGKQMFRRPLAGDEVASFLAIYKGAPSGREGIADVASAMVLAPEFLYHVEVGAGQPGSASQFTLTDYEVAARVAYFLTDGPPDAALTAAADAGGLRDPAVLGAHVDRLLESDAGRAKVTSFAGYWLTLDKFQGLPTAPAFLAGIDTAGLAAEMVREQNAYVQYITYDKRGTYADLLTSRRSFARTPALAKIYGHPLPASPTEEVSTDSARMGLLLRGPVLADSSSATHPILRGAFMLRRIVCNDIRSPSTADLAAREAADFTPDPLKFSTGEMTAQRTAVASCTGCHSKINPFGFSLEGFDNLGRARTIETMFDPMGAKIAEHPVVTSGALMISGTETVPVTSAVETMQALAKSVAAPMCFTKHVYRYYRMEHENEVDGCQLTAMFDAMQAPGGSILKNIKTSLVNVSLNQRRLK